MKRRALGRGLRSLIPEAATQLGAEHTRSLETDAGHADYLMIDIDRIQPNRQQPRQGFDKEALEQLARSLKEQGVLQPVIVRPLGDGYELVAGERRWRAAQLAGLLKVPAVVRSSGDGSLLELALIENLQREDLNPLEAAMAFHSLMEDAGLSQQEVAERVGKQRATVANMLRLLDLPPSVQDKVRQDRLTLGHAKALASLSDPAAQHELAERVIREGLSVRQVEKIVSRSGEAGTGKTARKSKRLDPNVAAAEETLQRALGTRVRIVLRKKGGRIELHFFSGDELERVYQLILGAARSPVTQ